MKTGMNVPAERQPQAVIYARYSSHAQRDVSIDQQLRECRRFAERQGIRIVDTYEDRALTGTSDKRPAFQQMVRDAENADWVYVIVYTLDRFARDRYDSAVYKRQLKNHGVKVLSAMENISDDPTGILLESMLEGLAEYYSKELARKTRRGMEDNAGKCLVNGPLPYGYCRGDDGRYAVVPAEAEIVRELFRRVSAGEPLNRILADLNSRGIRTKTGAAWSKSSFNHLLHNERYTGVYLYGDIRVEGGVPQIVSRELYDAVQYHLTTKPNPRTAGLPQKRRRENSVYLLTGKLFCGSCKSPMIGISGKSQSTAPYYYYICQKRRQDHQCSKKPVRRDRIELEIAKAIREYVLSDDVINDIADAVIKYRREDRKTPDVSFLEARHKEVLNSLNNLVTALEKGIITDTTQSRLLALESEEKQLRSQLAIAQENAAQIESKEQIAAAMKLFQAGDITDKAYQETLIDAFLVAAYVYDGELRIVFRPGGKQDTGITIPFDMDTLPDEDLITNTCSYNIPDRSPRCRRHLPAAAFFILSPAKGGCRPPESRRSARRH